MCGQKDGRSRLKDRIQDGYIRIIKSFHIRQIFHRIAKILGNRKEIAR